MRIDNLLILAYCLIAVSCSHGETDVPDAPVSTYPDDGAIRVTTLVNGNILGRSNAVPTPFSGDDFQLFIDPSEKLVNGVDANSDYHFQLKVEKTPGTTDWGVFSGTYGKTSPYIPLGNKVPLWAGPREQTEVKAYANYIDYTATITSLLLDQSTAEMSAANDLLYFYKSLLPGTDLDSSSKKLVIDFTHRLSQLNIILKFGTEFNRVEPDKTMDKALIKNVGIYEMQYTYSFDIASKLVAGSDGKFTYPLAEATGSASLLTDLVSDPTGVAHIVPYISKTLAQNVTASTITYTALVVPQKMDAGRHLVVITMYPMGADGKADTNGTIRNFVYTITDVAGITFESGKAYNLTLTVGKDQITGGTFSPAVWGEGSKDETITD